MDKEEIYRQVIQATDILGITECLGRKPQALSVGQRQRMDIRRNIVRNAKAFLMDEPLSNLDAKLRNKIRAEIILLPKRMNTTLIYVTHNRTEATTLRCAWEEILPTGAFLHYFVCLAIIGLIGMIHNKDDERKQNL